MGKFILSCLFLGIIAACARVPLPLEEGHPLPDFLAVGTELADQLVDSRREQPPGGERIIVASLVSLDDLEKTSSFGRAVGEAVSAALFRCGYDVVEIRKTPDIYLEKQLGTLVLSRDAAILARQQQLRAVVAGTYSLTPSSVIVQVKMLAADSAEVLAVSGLEIVRNSGINHLLADAGSGFSGALSAYE